MPNHCENDLYISGPAEAVAALLAHIGADQPEPTFDFNTIIPYPEKFKAMDAEAKNFGWYCKDSQEMQAAAKDAYVAKWGTDKDGYNSGGYEWCCENWGTKWGAYDVKRRDYQGVCLTFQTAWSPAKLIIPELHKLFQKCTLHLEYFERGMEFCGGLSCQSEDDYYDEENPWAPGIISSSWEGKYSGNRGG